MLLILISANAQTLRGDVNGDGKVDASDVSDLVTIILNAGLTEDDIYKKYNTPAISWIDDDFAAFDKQGKLTPVYQKLHDFCIAKGIYGDLALRPFSSPADAWIPTGMVDICKQWQSEGFEFLYHPTTPKAGTTAMPSTRTMPARLRLRRSTASRRSNSTDSTPHLSSCGQATQQSSPTICPS